MSFQSLTPYIQYSPFLSHWLASYPEWESELSQAVFVRGKKWEEEIANRCRQFIVQHGVEKGVRLFKHFELIRLSVSEMASSIPIEEVMLEWSGVADLIIQTVCDNQMTIIREKYPAAKLDYCIFAMGKLGAQELNFSSDIDLIYLYNSPDVSNQAPPNLSPHELANLFAQSITTSLSRHTADGYLFRVDLDLRPEGKQGLIIQTAEFGERYYEMRGADWERQAWIRARHVAGSRKLSENFLKHIRPFTYRKFVDWSILNKIKEMKKTLQQQIQSHHSLSGFNLKHGIGGIREVEFIVQAFQQLHGGRIESLRTHSTLKAISELAKQGLIQRKEAKLLKEAYCFYRHCENMLQIYNDQQTHSIPINKVEIEKLSNRVGMKNTLLDEKITQFTTSVHDIFTRLLAPEYEKVLLEEAMESNRSKSGHIEEEIDSLAWFKREEVRRLAAADMAGEIDPELLFHKLSLIAEVVIRQALDVAFQMMQQRAKWKAIIKKIKNPKLAIIGMGKLAGREMDYGSDLDLLFVYEGDCHTQEFFTAFVQRIITIISMHTRYGQTYQVDTDLRPSGKSGVLVAPLQGFVQYHEKTSTTWERQALIRSRAIAGDDVLMAQLEREISRLTFERALPTDYRQEIFQLRQRIEREKAHDTETKFDLKYGVGGLLDVESCVQYFQLKYGEKNPVLRQKNTANTLRALNHLELIAPGDFNILLQGYLFLRQWISLLRLSRPTATVIELDGEAFFHISAILKLSPEEAKEKINKTRTQLREIYLRSLERGQ